VDDQPVWSISCIFVAREARRSGLSVFLLRSAVEFARSCGARIIEGYPVEPRSTDMPAAFAWTGLANAYLKAGFVEVARHSPTRPIMRFPTA
jgi:GNAT superfamily N-acetyltransferase